MENTTSQGPEKPAIKQRVPMSDKARRNRDYFIYGIFGIIGLFIVAAASYGIIRVYFQGGTDKGTEIVASALRLPLAKVNGQIIYYTSYIEDSKAIRLLRDYAKKYGGEMAGRTDEQLTDDVMNRLIDNIIAGDLAKKFNISVSQEDIDLVEKQLLSQFADQQTAEDQIKQRYGWTFKQYEEKVIKPYILQGKLYEFITTGKQLRDDTIIRAQSVLDQIKRGASFEEMAKKYGEDGTAANGGDLGWFGKGEMVAQFEQAVFAMKKGEFSQELVESPEGFHIIFVDDRKTEKEKDNSGKMVDAEKIKARHIFFRSPSYEATISQEREKAAVNWYAWKIHNPISNN